MNAYSVRSRGMMRRHCHSLTHLLYALLKVCLNGLHVVCKRATSCVSTSADLEIFSPPSGRSSFTVRSSAVGERPRTASCHLIFR